MGAEFCTMSVPVLPEQEVRSQFEKDSYSGGFGMATGLLLLDREFPSVKEAEEFLQDDCVKWGEARAVKHGNLDGSKSYLIGAWRAS